MRLKVCKIYALVFCSRTRLSSAVMYTEKIPSGGPPSFSGRLVKYSYKLAVGAQKPNRPASIIRIPFRVMTIPGESMIVYCDILWYTLIYCGIL